jgi:hypothetical protein
MCVSGLSRRLPSQVARASLRCHHAGPERSAGEGRSSWVGLRPLRWPTARPDPAAGSRLCTTAHCSTNSYKNGTNASKYHKRRSRNENEYTARTLR